MLSQFVTAEIFVFLLIFCRVGSAIMLLPGFGELYVTSRTRLFLALMFSLVLVAPLTGTMPRPPNTVGGTFILIIGEILIGLMMGAMSRMLIAGVHMAGGIIAYQSSLASALTANIAGFSGQDTSLGNMLSMSVIVLIFVTDLHHVMLKSLMDSYLVFAPGMMPMMEDMAQHATNTMAGAFKVAMQMAAPHLVVGMMLYLGAGIIARLMPNLQVFFLLMPPQLLISFFILMFSISAILLWYLEYLREALSTFAAPV
ncbi:MAG: flagellar biosynthetic protein FliR [Rickettsiales bacterium]|nr:flagellar biosynthetic protein FliR [Rickettsiales bacterium]